jgi:hypothetical protein
MQVLASETGKQRVLRVNINVPTGRYRPGAVFACPVKRSFNV